MWKRVGGNWERSTSKMFSKEKKIIRSELMETLGKGIFFYSTTKGNEWLRKVELKIDWAEKLISTN